MLYKESIKINTSYLLSHNTLKYQVSKGITDVDSPLFESPLYSSASSDDSTPIEFPWNHHIALQRSDNYFGYPFRNHSNDDHEREKALRTTSPTITHQEALVSVGWQMDNPYILTGYRRALGSVSLCVYSIFGYLHNETFNILTHLIGALIFSKFLVEYLPSRIIYPINYWIVLESPQNTPQNKEYIDLTFLKTYLVCCIICLSMSASFHTLNCHSSKVSHRAHRCDYCGIVVLAVGSILPVIQYGFYDQEIWQLFYSGFIVLTGSISGFIVLSRKYRRRRLLRISTFLILGFSTLIPIFHLLITQGYDVVKQNLLINWMFKAGFCYLLGTSIYATRYPERLYPGKFDIFFSSHQIFHFLVVCGALCQYVAIRGMIFFHNKRSDNL
ncbi:uncharacterized protein L201_000883 [Kwoniella dendrophila CBS 6074]|uniref:Integral membrane protein n=1 Tax=Kwoniella dendrophila CBS 6074 TaxID=1295534 RepID=A0AAX4JKT8_9TREE